jgi:hypothetical protein
MTEDVVPLGEPGTANPILPVTHGTIVSSETDDPGQVFEHRPGSRSNPHPTPAEGEADMSVSTHTVTASPELKRRAIEMLEDIHRREWECRLHRVHYIKLARQYGVSFEEIGRALGITGAGARKFIQRADAA